MMAHCMPVTSGAKAAYHPEEQYIERNRLLILRCVATVQKILVQVISG